MSGCNDRQKRLVEEASGIIAAARGKVKITQAMGLVGFSTPERRDMKIYQQVRRRSMKVAVVAIAATKPAPIITSAVNSTVSVSSLSGATNSGSSQTPNSLGATARRPLLLDMDASSSSTVTQKKHRSTSKQVQMKHAVKASAGRRNKIAMKQITVLIVRNKSIPAGHSNKRTIVEIVNETNERLESNVSAKTAAQYVREGWIGKSPLRRGPIGQFEKRVWVALKGAYVTYLKLEQAASKKQSSIKAMSLLVNGCVNKAGFTKVRDDLTRKLKKETADQFDVGKANVVEQRRLMWTTSYNLEVWFNTWSNTLIDLGFARKKYQSETDRVEGSLYFYSGMLDRIGNLDETDGSLDDTTGQRGGRPPMTFFAPDVAGGGTAVNKSGYSATVICGSRQLQVIHFLLTSN